jgi:hypothetical protein
MFILFLMVVMMILFFVVAGHLAFAFMWSTIITAFWLFAMAGGPLAGLLMLVFVAMMLFATLAFGMVLVVPTPNLAFSRVDCTALKGSDGLTSQGRSENRQLLLCRSGGLCVGSFDGERERLRNFGKLAFAANSGARGNSDQLGDDLWRLRDSNSRSGLTVNNRNRRWLV